MKKVFAVWIFQIVFCAAVGLHVSKIEHFVEVPPVTMTICRLIAGLLLQMIINSEVENGLKIMKYQVNHYWKFKNGGLAYSAGLLQVFSAVLIAIINYAVITVSDNVLDLAKDFTALIIIAEIDNQFAEQSKESLVRDAVENTNSEYAKLFKIETTSSFDARRGAN